MPKKNTNSDDTFEGAFDALRDTAGGPRGTDDELPSEEAAQAIMSAAAERAAIRSEGHRGAAREFLASQEAAFLQSVLSDKPMDFDAQRRAANESRAAAAARLAAERDAEWNNASKLRDADEYQYGLLCPSCGKVGIYFYDNPLGRTLYHDDWFSAVKREKDQLWSMDMIPCQHCLVNTGQYIGVCVNTVRNGDPRRGRAFNVGGAFARFVVKMAKDPERLAREGILDAYMDTARRIGRESRIEKEAQGA